MNKPFRPRETCAATAAGPWKLPAPKEATF